MTLTEPPDGIVANLLNIEGKPEIALSVTGKGPVDELVTTMTLDGGSRARRLGDHSGRRRWPRHQRRSGGPIGTLVAPDFAPLRPADAPAGSGAVKSAGGVEVSSLILSGGQLALEGNLATTADGFLNRLMLSGIVADPSGAPWCCRAGRRHHHPARRAQGRFRQPAVTAGPPMSLAEGFTNGELAARDLTISASGVAANLADPAQRRITFNADGTVAGIASKDADITAALGDSAGFGLAGLWTAGEPMKLAELRLVGKALALALAGDIEDNVFDGRSASRPVRLPCSRPRRARAGAP